MKFKLGTKVTGAKKSGSNIIVSVENAKDPSKKEEVIIPKLIFILVYSINGEHFLCIFFPKSLFMRNKNCHDLFFNYFCGDYANSHICPSIE